MKSQNKSNNTALLLIAITGFIICATLMRAQFPANLIIKNTLNHKGVVTAFQVAEAGKRHAYDQLCSGSFTPVLGSANSIVRGHPFRKGFYSVYYNANKTLDTLLIRSYGTVGLQSTAIEFVCAIQPITTCINPNIEAAVTTRSAVSTFGNIRIDGRDWDPIDDLVRADGVLGIKSCRTLYQKENSKIGGRGKIPQKGANAGVAEQFASSVGYPTTPEEVLGIPPGSLDRYKTTMLPFMPFYGIVYYIPDGTVTCPDFKGSTGIFICHNSNWSAALSNIKGNFNGILIADRIDKVKEHTLIYGAVVTLSESEYTNAFGDGNADIRYSSMIINNLINDLTFTSDTTYKVVSWKKVE